MKTDHDYSEYAEHPRYGRDPRFTVISPNCELTGYELLGSGYRLMSYISDEYIPGTAVEADLDRQSSSPIPVLYYYDLRRICLDCNRKFIFFADEQKYWYEDLGFNLHANCVRCVFCRNQQHELAKTRQRYEELIHYEHRTTADEVEMADCCLSLIETSEFHRKQIQHVRAILNRIPAEHDSKTQSRCDELRLRLVAIEAESERE